MPSSNRTVIDLPSDVAETEQQPTSPALPWAPGERVGFALVGLGRLSLDELIPAFAQCGKARLTALMSGSPGKARKVAAALGLPESSLYGYDDYERLRRDASVEAVFLVLPNSLHAEHTVRAARAGKHVLCEKPMATSVAEGEQMIAACRDAGRRLMVAYRVQYEPINRLVRRWVRERTYGAVKLIEAACGQRQGDPAQWRLDGERAGGGAMPDIGIYCLNTARFVTGEEPAEVFAQSHSTPGDARFREIEEALSFQLRFPSGILASNLTSYAVHRVGRYRVYAETGWFGLDPAFAYSGLQLQRAHADGALERYELPQMASGNQFALEIDHFAECIRHGRQPFTPGEEGLQDQRLIEAIYESARTRQPVTLPVPDRLDAFRGPEP